MTPSTLARELIDRSSFLNNETDVHDAIRSIADGFDFDFALYAGIFSFGNDRCLTKVISNYPVAWQHKYDADGYINIDPVMEHCRSRLIPIVWSDAVCHSQQQRDFMEEARSHGLVSGISFPIHSRRGDVGVLSLARSRAITERNQNEPPTTSMMAHCALLAAFVHESVERIVKQKAGAPHASLTPRELECLKWVAAGKSTWAISLILGISEHGVLHHVRNIMRKFDVQTRHLAVLKAIACGIVSSPLILEYNDKGDEPC
ncbi:LuxR family transcriptional regulator [Burkholderia ubonensis]|uniref:LuxR family transcriptional regulator n=1 Tax=Burkholderia ubonensis TaxID=101571 RepID=UPI000A6949F3|nr:autoinducer binding domain-containing protein [Burkholderia ubonensis]